MNTLKQKLTSRKLWAAIAGIVAGLAAVFGLDENTIAQVAGLVTAAASVVAYIGGEAKVDAARLRSAELAALLTTGETAKAAENEPFDMEKLEKSLDYLDLGDVEK